MKKITNMSVYVDKNYDVFRRIDFSNGKTEYQHIKPIVDCIAVYEDGCPMQHPVIELKAAAAHDYIYKNKNIKDLIQSEALI